MYYIDILISELIPRFQEYSGYSKFKENTSVIINEIIPKQNESYK